MKNKIWMLCCLFNVVALAQTNEVQMNLDQNGFSEIYPNEPSICISKTNPSVLVGGANIAYQYLSTDNGNTWKTSVQKSSFGIWGDPVLHSDIDGNIYYVHLSRTSGKTKDYGFIDRIVIQTSTDDGQYFSDGSFTGLNEPKMQDKPWISTDDYSSSYKGNAYLTWTEFDKINSKKKKHQSRIQFSSSNDIGKTWTQAITISDSVGDCVDDDNTLEGATTAVGVNGEIYCAWAGHHKIYFDKSLDGGKTWGTDKVVFNQQSGWAMDIPHKYRSNGMPFLMVDNSPGKFTGRLYMVWGDDKLGDADVFMSYSDDAGTTWQTPKRVHSDVPNNGKSQYLPNVAIDQTSGHLIITYYDRRWSKHNVFSDVYASLSTDGGESFNEFRLNNLISGHVGSDRFSGDYIDVDFHAGKISAIWASYDGYAKIYNRTVMEQELEQLFPIHQVGQFTSYVSYDGKKPTIYAVTTRPTNAEIIYYKKRWFSKSVKEKSRESVYMRHRPGLQGTTELSIQATQKRRFTIIFTPEETEMYPNESHEIKID